MGAGNSAAMAEKDVSGKGNHEYEDEECNWDRWHN